MDLDDEIIELDLNYFSHEIQWRQSDESHPTQPLGLLFSCDIFIDFFY